MTAVLNR